MRWGPTDFKDLDIVKVVFDAYPSDLKLKRKNLPWVIVYRNILSFEHIIDPHVVKLSCPVNDNPDFIPSIGRKGLKLVYAFIVFLACPDIPISTKGDHGVVFSPSFDWYVTEGDAAATSG